MGCCDLRQLPSVHLEPAERCDQQWNQLHPTHTHESQYQALCLEATVCVCPQEWRVHVAMLCLFDQPHSAAQLQRRGSYCVTFRPHRYCCVVHGAGGGTHAHSYRSATPALIRPTSGQLAAKSAEWLGLHPVQARAFIAAQRATGYLFRLSSLSLGVAWSILCV